MTTYQNGVSDYKANLEKNVSVSLEKEEKELQQMTKEYEFLQEVFNMVSNELKNSETSNKYLANFCDLWKAVCDRQDLLNIFMDTFRNQEKAITKMVNEYCKAISTKCENQDQFEKLKQEIENLNRLIDAAHLREQYAQETITNLRHRVKRLTDQLELRTKLEAEGEVDIEVNVKTEKNLQKMELIYFELETEKQNTKILLAENEKFKQKRNAAEMEVKELQNKLLINVGELNDTKCIIDKLEAEVKKSKMIIDEQVDTIQNLHNEVSDLKNTNSEMQNISKIVKADKEKATEKYNNLFEKYTKISQEFSEQANGFQTISKSLNVLGSEIKKKEVELLNGKKAFDQLSKVVDLWSKKCDKAELIKKVIEEEKEKLSILIIAYEKDVKFLKSIIEDKDKTIASVNREKLQLKKMKASLIADMLDITKRLDLTDQIKTTQKVDLLAYEKTLFQYKQVVHTCTNDKERYHREAKELTLEVAVLNDQLKSVTTENSVLKKSEEEFKANYDQQQRLLDDVRTDRNVKAKECRQLQNQIEECKEKLKDMVHQVEQLKEGMTTKENQVNWHENAQRKLLLKNESLTFEVQRLKNKIRRSDKTMSVSLEELRDVKMSLENMKTKNNLLLSEMNELMKKKNVIGSQLVRRNDEISLLWKNIKILRITLDTEKNHHDQRVNDIKILKRDMGSLRQEKLKLSKQLNNMADFRKEIFQLEKNLAKEKLKCRSLEEQAQTPLNIHRWRKLEGSDPSKLNLIQKVKILQKRLLKNTSLIQEKEKEINDWKEKYELLKITLSRYTASDATEKLWNTQYALRSKVKELQNRNGIECGYRSVISNLKTQIEHLKNNVAENKKKYFQQKKITERYKKELDTLKK